MTSKIEGRRERFHKWVLATKHPVLGFLDGHWLARGDDREGYANEYVQGLWVAFKEFAAPEAPRQLDELDALWADAHYLCARVSNGSLDAVVIAERIRKSIETCRAPLSPDHSGGAGEVVLPSYKEIQSIKTKAARQADLTSGANYFTAAEFAADAMLDKVKELNQ